MIGGGEGNSIFGHNSVIGGGLGNYNSGDNSIIGGGQNNTIESQALYSVLAGGEANTILTSGTNAVILGGQSNSAAAYALAAGYTAQATNTGAFVWSDGTGTLTTSTTNNSVTMRASGGFRFLTGTNTVGTQLAPGGVGWVTLSDRNMKKDFTAVDTMNILEQLAAIPITRWHYNWEDSTATPHIGPMAQDFQAAFGVGEDNRHISTSDADGVALAAIQGLNEKLEARSQKLEAENTELKARLEKLEQLLTTKK